MNCWPFVLYFKIYVFENIKVYLSVIFILGMVFVWTASKIDDATFCPRFFYYAHILKIPLPTTGAMALGIFMHRAMSKWFWDDRGRLRYKTAESFTNICKARWKKFVIGTGKIRGKEIAWLDEDEPWRIANYGLPLICRNVYDVCSQEEIPLFRESRFDFELDGRRYAGIIDAIIRRDNKIIVRDYKSGRRKPGQMKLDFDPQFTLYFLAVASLCHGDKRFAEALKVDDETRKKWAGNPEYLPEMIEGEYFLMREKEILPMTREDYHYYDFCNMLEGLEKMIEDEEFEPHRGRLCDYCGAKERCREDTLNLQGKRSKQVLIFSSPKFVDVREARNRLGNFRQRRLRWPRQKKN